MLQHHAEEEHAPDLGLTPAPGQSQVTPQELTQAIVAVEARQRSSASNPTRQRDTTPAPMRTASLEDTIRQLELTMTPAELLAELHAQRTAAHQKAVMTPRKTGRSLSWWLMLAGLVLSTVTTACVSLLLFTMVKRYDKLVSAFYNRPPSAGLRRLTAFSPHDPAYVSFKDLQALANGKFPGSVWAAPLSTTTPGAVWGVEQENGRYVVRTDSLHIDSQHTAASAADKTEWVSPAGAGEADNYTRNLPIERFKHIKHTKTVYPTSSGSPVVEVELLRGSD